MLISAMIRQSPEIQKILAFEGIFEKLFGIITQEGGLDGGLFIEDILKVVDTLLRYNTSNQVNFAVAVLGRLIELLGIIELFPRNEYPFATVLTSLFRPQHPVARAGPSGICASVLEFIEGKLCLVDT